jgi:hypothetical protein
MDLVSKIYTYDDDMLFFSADIVEIIVVWEIFKDVMQKQFDITETIKASLGDGIIKERDPAKMARALWIWN